LNVLGVEMEMKRKTAEQLSGRGLRGVSLGFALFFPLVLSGCHKKTQVVVLPQSQAPATLATPPDPSSPALIEAPPVNVPPTPTAAAASQPRRQPRRPAPKPAAPPAPVPTQVASAEGVGEGSSAIGALTAGGDASPQVMQEVTDLIASNDKRLKALPAKTVKAQQAQLSKINNFQRQAQEALRSGDATGAKTLATKALLLLNDLDRGA
jgi:hypothetical protein